MKRIRFPFILPVFLGILIIAISCSPKTTPTGQPNVSVSGNVSAEIPPDRTEFTWTTYDAKPRNIEEARQNIEKLMKEYGVTGLSLVIKQNQWPQNTGSFLLNIGAENRGVEKPVDSMTIFRADRLGQPILAYIVLQLATYKQFDIDKPILEYLPESSLSGSPFSDLAEDPRTQRLTARRILSHQGGLPNSRMSLPEKKLKFILPPGKEFLYSEEAYELLRHVLEQKFNLSLNEMAQRLVFVPFNMKRSSFVKEPRFEGHLAATDIDKADPSKTPSVERTAFFTNAVDYMEFMWLVRLGNPYLARNDYESYILNPISSIRSISILDAPGTGKRSSLPPKLGWCLGWGNYFIRRVDLVGCNFVGQKESGGEAYAAIFEALMDRSTALVAFIVTDSEKSFMPVVSNEFLGKIETPLAWLGFK